VPEETLTSSRWREVVDTAARLFHERGYQGISMDDIADAVGITKGALYHHFDSKAEILTAIYEEAADLILARTHKHSGGEPAGQVLRALIRDILEVIDEHRDYITVYYQEMRWLSEWLSRGDARRIQAKVRAYIDFVDGVIERGVGEGTLKPIDSRLTAYALIGMASWAYQWFDPKGTADLDLVAEQLTTIFVQGVGVASGAVIDPV
jgi:AcrR family transcriptional regulator